MGDDHEPLAELAALRHVNELADRLLIPGADRKRVLGSLSTLERDAVEQVLRQRWIRHLRGAALCAEAIRELGDSGPSERLAS
jgi:hypothetical protein